MLMVIARISRCDSGTLWRGVMMVLVSHQINQLTFFHSFQLVSGETVPCGLQFHLLGGEGSFDRFVVGTAALGVG